MRRCKRCYCLNNNDISTNNNNALEQICNNYNTNDQNYDKNCTCGFDDDNLYNVLPLNPNLAQSYVPIQTLDETFKPCLGLKCGTIYPELVSPYSPGDSIKQIKYLENSNVIGEGCNNYGSE